MGEQRGVDFVGSILYDKAVFKGCICKGVRSVPATSVTPQTAWLQSPVLRVWHSGPLSPCVSSLVVPSHRGMQVGCRRRTLQNECGANLPGENFDELNAQFNCDTERRQN